MVGRTDMLSFSASWPPCGQSGPLTRACILVKKHQMPVPLCRLQLLAPLLLPVSLDGVSGFVTSNTTWKGVDSVPLKAINMALVFNMGTDIESILSNPIGQPLATVSRPLHVSSIFLLDWVI